MPIKLRYDDAKKLLYATITNDFHEEEIKTALDEITTSKEYSPNINTLWDVRQLSHTHFNADVIRRIALVRKKFPKRDGARIAVVASSDLGFGMSRMYEFMTDDISQQLVVFRDFEAAENWLLEGNS